MVSSVVLEAAARGDAARLASLLRADARLLEITDENGCSPLQRAAADGHVEVVQLLLQHGADPNKQDLVHGNTAIHEAAWKGYSRCVALLAAAGADLRIVNAGGFAPLHLACQNGHNQSCREILLAGGDPDLHNNYGDTSLHTAARYGHAGVTRILISAQCRVSEQNKNGDTALHIAAAMGRRKLTRILLEAGCDKSIKNHQGETARDIAIRKGLEEIVNILNTPVVKQTKKKERNRSKSKERIVDEPDDGMAKDKNKEKKKKNVHFEKPAVNWSPYGCHYYPDPKFFPKPKLSSLPTEPLKKGEQYYLDLAGNIKKGPIGAGYTCYCAHFFKHMEEKMNMDKKDLKKHLDIAHEKIDQRVTDLEMKTQGQISELTRFVAAERAMCKERHQHLEEWLNRGITFRASERVKKLDYSPKGSIDIAPLKRTRSLEFLETQNGDCNKVNRIIKNFNVITSDTKEFNNSKSTSKSTEVLDVMSRSPKQRYSLKNSKSSDHLDAGSRWHSKSPSIGVTQDEKNSQNVTAEVHVKPDRISATTSPVSKLYNDRIASPSQQSPVKSPCSSISRSDHKISDSDADHVLRNITSVSPQVPTWKSQVLKKTSDDIMKSGFGDKRTIAGNPRTGNNQMDVIVDGYVKIPKQEIFQLRGENSIEREPIRPVQELVAKAELQQICNFPNAMPFSRRIPSIVSEAQNIPVNTQSISGILKLPQQPQRPAPALKEKPPKSKRFSFHSLIPFPSRKSFQSSPKENGNNSESSDEEDNPIRSKNQPGPMRNCNLLQTLQLPNYESVSNKSQSPVPQSHVNQTAYPQTFHTMVPKDAYFHELPNRQNHLHMPYRKMTDNASTKLQYSCRSQYDLNQPGLPESQFQARNRNPLHPHETGIFDAMMNDHVTREIDRMPHCYSDRLDQNTEVEIANQNDNFREGFHDNRACTNFRHPHMIPNIPIPDHNLLHSRLQSLAINTHLTETQSQTDRESHNDSGYSTKVYGSSQGPSPSLSGHVESADNISGQRVNIMQNIKAGQINRSSLV